MDPQSKRKRGRPSTAATAPSDPREDRASKRKRVEPAKVATDVEPVVEEEDPPPDDSQLKKRKRGRPSNASIAEQPEDEDEPRSSRATRKERVNYGEKRKYISGNHLGGHVVEEESRGFRERKRVDYKEKRRYSSGNHNGEEEEPSSQTVSPKKAGDPRTAPKGQEAQTVETNGAGKKPRAARPPKPKQADNIEQEDEQPNRASRRKEASRSQASAASQHEPDRPSKKRGRPSFAEPQTSKSPSSPQMRRRGRPVHTDPNEEEQNQSESHLPKKRRGRSSNVQDEAIQSKKPIENGRPRNKKTALQEGDGPAADNAPKRKKQRRSSPEPETEGIEEDVEIAHQRLVPKEHKINRDIIDTKWNLLPPGAITRVSSILNEAQRPVMHRLQSEQVRSQAHSAISAIIRKVERKLTKGLPFPPSTRISHREEDFDLEKILKHNRNLENQLTVLHHSNGLLIADRKKEETLLAKETEMLKKLEASIKEEQSFNKAELRKSDHPLLKKSKTGDTDDEIILATKPRVDLTNLQLDENLEPVIQQIHGHMDSMQGNIEQIKDIGSAISETKATVEDVLFKHLDTTQYEQVVLGGN